MKHLIPLVAVLAATAFSQPAAKPKDTPKPPAAAEIPPGEQVITLDVTRVNLLFTVTDKKGRFVNNLTKDEFEVTEEKRKQQVLEFIAETDLPLRMALLIDTSNSVRSRFRFEVEAAAEFLNSLVRKERDKALLYSYDTTPELVADLTDDAELLARKMKDLRPGGGTALYDAVYLACRDKLALDQPRHKFRRALVIIGDGEDNASRYSRDQALEMAHRSEVQIFSVSTNITKSETDGDKVLKYFAAETGGLALFPFKVADLAQDFENIANQLRSQYSILYRPEPLKTDGMYHGVAVKIPGRKDLVVRVRKGYYAPLMR